LFGWGHAVLVAIVRMLMLDSFVDQCLDGWESDHENFGICLDWLLFVALSTQEDGVCPVPSLEGFESVFSNADVGPLVATVLVFILLLLFVSTAVSTVLVAVHLLVRFVVSVAAVVAVVGELKAKVL